MSIHPNFLNNKKEHRLVLFFILNQFHFLVNQKQSITKQ